MRHRRVAVLLLLTVALMGCGKSSTSESKASTAGKAADASKASRTIDVHITAGRQFEPSTMTVQPGETVTFNVFNDDSVVHEFVLGDAKAQNDYEKYMASMNMKEPAKMPDQSYLIDVDPGQSKKITWSFPSTGGTTVLYGSHQPGDYAGGLKGTITVG